MTEPAKKAPAKRQPSRGRAKTEAAAEDTASELRDVVSGAPDTGLRVTGAPDTGLQFPLHGGFIGPGRIMPYEGPEITYPSVHVLWCAVMDSVKSVEKGDYNKDQHFRFRGIDAVMEAVGPALRRHGVHVRPRRILEHSATEYTTKNNTRMVNRVVRVEWEVTGPGGDSFVGESMGEAADAGDKSLTKAQSVAYRVFLLNALTIPTGDPDPDGESHERATPSAVSQAVAQASEKTYVSREEFERERAAAAQQSTRQAQAGEENQAAQSDIEQARADMWRVAKGLGWEWGALVNRFKSDHDGRETKQATKAELEAFAAELTREAEAEEERAKAAAAEVLGAKEVQPDEAQSGGPLL